MTDVIVYVIDAGEFEDLMARHPDVERYLDAHFSVTTTAAEFLRARTADLRADLPELGDSFSTREAVRLLMDNRSEAARTGDMVLTAADLALFCGGNPARLLTDIYKGRSVGELTPLLRLAEKDAIDAGFQPPQARYAWFAYGTLARWELLRFVPPKAGIVFDANRNVFTAA